MSVAAPLPASDEAKMATPGSPSSSSQNKKGWSFFLFTVLFSPLEWSSKGGKGKEKNGVGEKREWCGLEVERVGESC